MLSSDPGELLVPWGPLVPGLQLLRALPVAGQNWNEMGTTKAGPQSTCCPQRSHCQGPWRGRRLIFPQARRPQTFLCRKVQAPPLQGAALPACPPPSASGLLWLLPERPSSWPGLVVRDCPCACLAASPQPPKAATCLGPGTRPFASLYFHLAQGARAQELFANLLRGQ